MLSSLSERKVDGAFFIAVCFPKNLVLFREGEENYEDYTERWRCKRI